MSFNTENRTTNASKNAIASFVNKIILLLLTFISRKFFIKYIGVNYLGISGLFSNILSLLSLADLGMGTAMNVSLYKPISEKNTIKISALINYFKKLYHLIAFSVFCIGAIFTPFLKYIVRTDIEIPNLWIYYLIFVTKSSISYLFVYKTAIIKADQRTYLITRIDVWINIIKVCSKILIVILFKNYLLYILIDVVAVLIHNLLVSNLANQNYPFIKENINELDKNEKLLIFSDISSIFIYKIAGTLITSTDNILMSIICGTIYVGLYSNYHTITTTIESFIILLFTSLTASIGNLIVKEKSDKQYKTFKIMQMVSYWLCAIVCICLFYLTQDFIQLWFGKELLLDKITLIAIVINVFFSICNRPVWTFREGTGMYKQIKYIMLIASIINLFLSILLGKILGISGILFATSISKFITYFWYEPYLLFKNTFYEKIHKYYFSFLLNLILIFVCFITCWIPIRLIKDVSIVNWFIKGFICIFIITFIYLIRYIKTPEFLHIKKVIQNFIKKK